MEQISIFKEKLNSNDGVLGLFMKTEDPAFVEIAGYSHFDFVILDMEHGPGTYLHMQNLVRAAQLSGAFPIIRVTKAEETLISRALDIGAFGIQIPQIESAEQARLSVSAAKYSPDGNRGVCRYVRAAKYSATNKYEYLKDANDSLVILQLEGVDVLNELDSILDVPGIDIIFIGPYDLSASLNLPGQVDHPKVQGVMKTIIEKASKKQITVGTFTDSIESARFWRTLGVKYLAFSTDVGVFTNICNQSVTEFHTKL